MKKLLWLLGGTMLALGVLALLNPPSPAFADDAEDEAATKVGGWGSKQRIFGTGGQVKGKVEQGIGNVTGNDDLANQGAFDEVAGTVQDAVGKAANAVSKGIHSVTK